MTRKVVDAGLLILVIFVAAFYYLYQEQVQIFVRGLIYGLPCSKPITYTLGEIDGRFDLSEEEVLGIVKKSEDIWEKASGKNLFEYSPTNGGVVVNFKYDRRQAVTEELNTLSTSIETQSAEYQTLKKEYDAKMAKYQNDKLAFEAKKRETSERQRKYNVEVAYWNRRGGAPQETFTRLNAEKAALNENYAKLNQEAESLNNAVREINKLVKEMNSTVSNYNTNINTYNNATASLPAEFREGEYISDGKNQEINIYQFDDEPKLLRVLAHELAHSLGVDHVEDPKAIMYSLNSGTSITPTAADLVALEAVCKTKK